MSPWIALILLHMTGNKMPEANIDLVKGPFGLQDEQFWSKPLWQQSVVDFRIKLGDDLADGMYLDTPDRIYADRHKGIPLAMLRSGPTDKLYDHNLRTTTRLVLSHLETGTIQIVKLAEPGTPKKRPTSPGWTSTELEVDLKALADLGPGLGSYQAMLLCGPEASNRKAFALYPSPALEKDKTTQESLGKLRKEGGSPARLVDRLTLDLKKSSPAPSDAPAWKAALKRTPKGDVRLALEFHIPVLPRFILPPEKQVANPDGSKVKAVLPVFLAGFDENRALCLGTFLGLPIEDAPAGSPEKPVLASALEFSLTGLLGAALPKETLTVWALTMDQVTLAELTLGTPSRSP